MTDVFAEAEGLKRRRALLEALQQQSMGSPIQGPAQYGGLQAIMKVISGVLAQKTGGQLDTATEANRAAYGSQLGEGVQKFLGQMQGSPGGTLNDQQAEALMTRDQAPPPLPEPVAPNPHAAIVGAMTSRFPEMQALGKQELINLGKKPEETFGNPVTERDAQGRPIQVQYGNRGTRKMLPGATPFEKPMVVNNRVVDPVDPKTVLANYDDEFDPPELRKGADGQMELYQKNKTNGQYKKLDNAPKTVIQNVMKAQNLGFGEWAKEAVKEVVGMSKTARASAELSRTLDQLGSLSEAGTYSGPMADPAVWLGQLGKSLGMKLDVAQLQNSETYNGVATEAWQKVVSQFGGNRGVTAQEAEKIKEIIPQLKNSPEARVQMTAIMKQVARRNIDDAQRANEELSKALIAEDASKFSFGLSSATMPNPAGSSPQPAPQAGGLKNKWGDPVRIGPGLN